MIKQNINAQLILENGTRFLGTAAGYAGETVGEVVFTTSMTGYQETLTDPSYYGQIVVMTYPLIGNYGVNAEYIESETPKVKGFIVKENCSIPNNFRCEGNLNDYLNKHKIIAIEGIDTRGLTQILRTNGTMRGIIAPYPKEYSESELNQKFNSFNNSDAVDKVATDKAYEITGENKHVAIIDMGIKQSIINEFKRIGCRLTVFPSKAKTDEILSANPDIVFISNGPGNPKDATETISTIQELIGKKPVLGICLGHQIIALALGGEIEKLNFGHHGANYPVKSTETGKVCISSQNHNYVVSKLPEDVKVTFKNINDNTIEGISCEERKIYSIQFYPEAYPAPMDLRQLIGRVINI